MWRPLWFSVVEVSLFLPEMSQRKFCPVSGERQNFVLVGELSFHETFLLLPYTHYFPFSLFFFVSCFTLSVFSGEDNKWHPFCCSLKWKQWHLNIYVVLERVTCLQGITPLCWKVAKVNCAEYILNVHFSVKPLYTSISQVFLGSWIPISGNVWQLR